MSLDNAEALLRELRAELEREGDAMDDATRECLRALDADIQALLAQQEDAPDSDSIISRATEAEAEFAARHPVAGGFLRQLVDTLSRMGI